MRKFFMGVLGWTPETVMREASLYELHDAWLGYAERHGAERHGAERHGAERHGAERHGIAAAAPAVTAVFLNDMLQRFPDGRK